MKVKHDSHPMIRVCMYHASNLPMDLPVGYTGAIIGFPDQCFEREFHLIEQGFDTEIEL